MKDEKNLRRSYIARHRQTFKKAADLAALMDEKHPNDFTDGDMVTARDLANEISQCVHEMNAYRNTLLG